MQWRTTRNSPFRLGNFSKKKCAVAERHWKQTREWDGQWGKKEPRGIAPPFHFEEENVKYFRGIQNNVTVFLLDQRQTGARHVSKNIATVRWQLVAGTTLPRLSSGYWRVIYGRILLVSPNIVHCFNCWSFRLLLSRPERERE